jgi:hypothetical protein
MLNKQFVKAKIEEQSSVYILTITYCWYWLYYFEETYVCQSVEDCKSKLISERTNDHLSVITKDGVELKRFM